MTYLSPRILPLSQDFHCHLRCYEASCSCPVLYHSNGLSVKERDHLYTSPIQSPQDSGCVQTDLKVKKQENSKFVDHGEKDKHI